MSFDDHGSDAAAGAIERPSIIMAALSTTALSNVVTAAALLLCFFLPHSVGCDQVEYRPAGLAADNLADGETILSVIYLWPYLFAFFTIICFGILVYRRPQWFDRALLILPIGFSCLLFVCWCVFLFSGSADSRMAMNIAAIVAPLGAIVALRMIWLCREGEILTAAAWGQSFLCVLAVFSLRWFWIPPVSRLLLGGISSIISATLMMVASWTWITHARHDLCDRRSASLPIQVTLWQVVVAVALVAIALTYWRVFSR